MKSRGRRFPWHTFPVEHLVPALDIRRTRTRAGIIARRRTAGLPEAFSVLDLGTTHLKALVCRRNGSAAEVLGQRVVPYGILEQAPSSMAELCNQALTQAEDDSAVAGGRRLVPDDVVIGVPASTVVARSSQVAYRRRNPTLPLDDAELERILYIGQRTAIKELQNDGLPFSDAVLLVAGTQMRVAVAGHPADDPRGLCGEIVTLTLFNMAASRALLRALGRLAEGLQLTVSQFMVPAQAVVNALGPALSQDGIGIDMGGRRTIIARWHQGIMQGWTSIPLGGQDFALALQRAYHLDRERAEQLKCWYGEGRLSPDHAEGISEVLRSSWEHWKDQLIEALVNLQTHGPLPGYFWLWGGGSRLNGAVDVVRAALSDGRLSFDGYPQVRMVDSAGLRNLRLAGAMDPLAYNGYAMAVAFARQAEGCRLTALIQQATEAVCRAEHLDLWTMENE
ncbi:MAG: hypothetical protein ACUVWB_06450 [Anaerolineae bacterium]